MRLLCALLVCAFCCAAADTAKFTKDGSLIRPADYREWVFLSSGLGMTYGPNAPAPGSRLRFDNVYVNPSSYRAFLKSGKWPDGTILILEIRESESKGSINQHGHYQTSLAAIEANVKDSRRFGGNGWAFFDVNGVTAKRIPVGNRCEQCHSANGAVDNTFVQFYPELLKVAEKLGTVRRTPTTVQAGH